MPSARAGLLREFTTRVYAQCDALIAPVLSFGVPRISDVEAAMAGGMLRMIEDMTRLTRPVNVLGLPALSVPCGFLATGLPCGMQLIGRPFDEALLYRIGAAYQTVTDWHSRAPCLATR